MYDSLLATSTGRFINARVSDRQMVMRMIELSDHDLSALGALTDALPANLANRYKRLAGYLVKRVMRLQGYVIVPGLRSRIPGPSLFKRGACYRAVGHTHPEQEGQRMSTGTVCSTISSKNLRPSSAGPQTSSFANGPSFKLGGSSVRRD
jgi:hypothetical protein